MGVLRGVGGVVGVLVFLLVGVPVRAVAEVRQASTFTLSGTLWNDHDGSGDRDAGDEAKPCPWIALPALYDPDTHTQIPGLAADTIDPDGTYQIADVPPGTYEIAVACGLGWPGDVNVGGGGPIRFADVTSAPLQPFDVVDQDIDGLDFGVFIQPLLVGQAFLDANRDGVRQGDEPGLDGCSASSTHLTDGEVETTSTAPTTFQFGRGNRPGIFEFGLHPGAYRIGVSCDGYQPTTPSTIDVTPRSGENIGIDPVTCAHVPSPCIAEGDAPRFGFAPIDAGGPGTTASTLARTGARPGDDGLSAIGVLLVAVGAALVLTSSRSAVEKAR